MAGQAQGRQITGDMLLNDFFIRIQDQMIMAMFNKIFEAEEEASKVLDDLFTTNMKGFDATFQQIAKQDVSGYIELKKVINEAWEDRKKYILSFYNEVEMPEEEEQSEKFVQ